MTRALGIGLAILALASCSGGNDLPVKPQLKLDRSSIGFGQEFGSGTFVGTSPQQSIQITNGGQQDLVISGVTLTGDPAFTKNGPSSTTLKSNEQTFIQLIFTPPAAGPYTAKLTIASNADNAPSQDVPVTGKGIDISKIAINPSCGTDGGGCPQVKVSSTVQLNAIATFSDGSDGGQSTTSNVNSIATWSSSDNSIATIDTNGNATGVMGLSDGGAAEVTISATAHNVTGSTKLIVHY